MAHRFYGVHSVLRSLDVKKCIYFYVIGTSMSVSALYKDAEGASTVIKLENVSCMTLAYRKWTGNQK